MFANTVIVLPCHPSATENISSTPSLNRPYWSGVYMLYQAKSFRIKDVWGHSVSSTCIFQSHYVPVTGVLNSLAQNRIQSISPKELFSLTKAACFAPQRRFSRLSEVLLPWLLYICLNLMRLYKRLEKERKSLFFCDNSLSGSFCRGDCVAQGESHENN